MLGRVGCIYGGHCVNTHVVTMVRTCGSLCSPALVTSCPPVTGTNGSVSDSSQVDSGSTQYCFGALGMCGSMGAGIYLLLEGHNVLPES